jgi:hypothetical protein
MGLIAVSLTRLGDFLAIVLLLEAQFDMEPAKMKSPEIINFLPNQFFIFSPNSAVSNHGFCEHFKVSKLV